MTDKVYQSPPRRPQQWLADRPGDVVGEVVQPTGPALGNQGPDQGYVLKLSSQFAGSLVLAPGEHEADAIAGACSVALRRASILGRGPVVDDLRLALTIFGYLSEAPAELVTFRREMFDEVHHQVIHYRQARDIADLVPEMTLRSSVGSVEADHAVDWRGPLGLAT